MPWLLNFSTRLNIEEETALVSFPVTMIKHPDKSNLHETGLIGLQFKGTVRIRGGFLEAGATRQKARVMNASAHHLPTFCKYF